jgi:hypothetical protein
MSSFVSCIAALPLWLHVRIDPKVDRRWHFVAGLFAAAAHTVIGDTTPHRALVRLRTSSEGMELRFFASASLATPKSAALTDLAERVSELANALLRQQQEEPAGAAMRTLEDVLREAPNSERAGAACHDATGEVQQQVRVFNWDETLRFSGGAERGREPEGAARIARTLKRLKGTGAHRPLSVPPAMWQQIADELAVAFPNFSAVVTSVIRPHVAMLARGIRHRLPPLLLVGPPGIGKTLFAHNLAHLLSVPPPLMISIASETSGSALGGSSTFWSNSNPGKLFEFLAWGERGLPAVADGLVVLDEVDKVGTDPRYDPLGALYTLLEADTARAFQDQSLPDVVIDASHLRVVCTANELDAIPAPLRSRMAVFDIQSPSPEQAGRIVLSMYRSLVSKLGVSLDADLPADVVEQAIKLEPRRARMLLEAAIASAVCAERTCLENQDWVVVQCAGAPARRQAIGFIGER